MADDRLEIAKLVDETTCKALEQTQRIVAATASVNERAGTAGAEIIRHGAEAVQEALLSGVQLAANLAKDSADQFSKALGLSGDGAQKAVDQTTANIDAIVESGSILTEMMQSVTKEWMEFANERVEKNLDQLGRLARCHTPHEFVSIQSELVRDNLQDWLDCARRMAKRSVRTAEQATIKITEQIGQAA